ncbi:Heterochromatin-associated protein HP1 and related CHROMO domain proteins [Plasmopara halstedii]|uniref:Heterochromatin-associated protein HP1 and related CHROMO domain proteins n=1 Tax=Plasmopara halstedii TaxID=4781 RepID=A0A0P1ABQ6_PLAHL|nr:Heterochromatin-associated protein HP1 and related CHROMO domain proteins [Plasmopara halstedii]CEG38346.1 Heterochromatin-associated protein HP1 and related CHROMO domain proteins [Plasmopara halstedii]|eukprot:XP_024574715.1 Heterochromatin-associated protein HP1 and related CHROMO domain proteins [Plasmopara halstedii]
MPDIERIVDRKLIKQRVHYLVIWKGFGRENNTWESRIDLMADGYSHVIKDFENQRRESDNLNSRGRSPRRSRSKSPGRSRSPSRSRSRRHRSRSVSVSRNLPESDNDDVKERKHKDSLANTSTPSQRRKSPRNNENNDSSNDQEGVRRRSSRKQVADETSPSTRFVSRMEDDEDSVLLRSTLAALVPQVREMTSNVSSARSDGNKKPVVLMYEEESGILCKSRDVKKTASSKSGATSAYKHTQISAGSKLMKSGYLMSIFSVAVVVGSLVASEMLAEVEDETKLWRKWLSFLTPVVALLLFFHQKNARASAKWVATGLAWRAAAELLLLLEVMPRQFEMMVAISTAVANISLLVALVSIFRNGEHKQSKATLVLVTIGILTLFLSDSWVISTGNTELRSRVILMSVAVLTIALSPIPMVSLEDDN